MPAIARNRVDLPAPEGPDKRTDSPRGNSRRFTSTIGRPVGSASSTNMRAKPLALPFQIAGETEIIESGFADGNDLLVPGQVNELFYGRLVYFGAVRVHATEAKRCG